MERNVNVMMDIIKMELSHNVDYVQTLWIIAIYVI